jgi:parallel beta-helix repeat protein
MKSYPIVPRRTSWVLITLLFVQLLAPNLITGGSVAAQASVPVRYSAAQRTIFVGADYSDSASRRNPASAPKTTITIAQVAAALPIAGLLSDQGSGTWLLSAHLVVSGTARLEIAAPTVQWLRLDSTPGATAINATLITKAGQIVVQNSKITSWNTTTAAEDTLIADGRSWMLAESGGRLDIMRSAIGYLGWAAGKPSGLSWRERADSSDPTTGATGSIIDSSIYQNYFGHYSFEAYALQVRGNRFFDNISYGFDPHDYSSGFVVENNDVYNNGNHGIIFSRGCTNNIIRNNRVYGNANHGIMLDRGSNNNIIENNLVYNNDDGIAIFQSSNNTIRNNTLRDNLRGIRVNATYDADDVFDGISTNNTLSNNRIENNAQYGIYLYERADRNSIIQNTLLGNADSAVYIKTFNNTIRSNDIRTNGRGVVIIGGELTPIPPGGPNPVPALGKPGRENLLTANVIEENDRSGIQIITGTATIIGARLTSDPASDGNLIRANGAYGISISGDSDQNIIRYNAIEANGRDGILIKGANSSRNRISQNAITANIDRAINISSGAQVGITAPTIDPGDGPTITGTAPANATIEIYRDSEGEGRFFKGTTNANSNGSWSFTLPTGDNPTEGNVTAIALDGDSNTSAFGGNLAIGAGTQYTIGVGRNGEPIVYITGTGSQVTIPIVRDALRTISPTVTLIDEQGGGVWQSNISLFFSRGVTLRIDAPEVTWLKLRSQAADIQLQAADPSMFNYRSFVTLRTHNGSILINGSRITSWDPIANDYDRDISNGRAYLLAKYNSRMDISNAELSYLGFGDGESYGISWRDTNEDETPDVLQTRVTGQVSNSSFSYNYYGIYTYQASGMTFRGNQFHHNIGYGFDPHDFSNGFVVENNQAYENGNHGFIISRGCNNFIIRNNQSFNNRYRVGTEQRLAHGFMLDAGSPLSRYPQIGSFQNLVEGNLAWGNDGYGLRILGSDENTVRANEFRDNLQGISIEQGSSQNRIEQNKLHHNRSHGIFLTSNADNNTIQQNTIEYNSTHGIYIKTGRNLIQRNSISDNGSLVAGTASGSGIAFLRESDNPSASVLIANQVLQNTIVRNAEHGIEIKNGDATLVRDNIVEGNRGHGVYLTNTTLRSLVTANRISANFGHGIRANGSDSILNTWRENTVYGNGTGAAVTTSSANGGIRPPEIMRQALTATSCQISGNTLPHATVEIYTDLVGQARFFEGRVVADTTGAFLFSADRPCSGKRANAFSTDSAGNSSGFASNIGDRVLPNQIFLPVTNR